MSAVGIVIYISPLEQFRSLTSLVDRVFGYISYIFRCILKRTDRKRGVKGRKRGEELTNVGQRAKVKRKRGSKNLKRHIRL